MPGRTPKATELGVVRPQGRVINLIAGDADRDTGSISETPLGQKAEAGRGHRAAEQDGQCQQRDLLRNIIACRSGRFEACFYKDIPRVRLKDLS